MAFEKSSAGTVAGGGMVGADGQLNVPTELENGMFPEHPKSGTDWFTLKGMKMEPYELDGIESDSSHAGVARGYAPADGTPPMDTIEVNTPLTMGGGAFAK